MSQLLAGLGISGGYQSSSTKTSSSGSQANTYSPEQTALQTGLSKLFSSLLPGIASGTMTPDVTAAKTGAADSINKTYSGLGDRMNRFFASRGFGQSGTAGKAALQTELGRAGAIGTNEANFAGIQLDQNNKLLTDALAAAYQTLGSSFTQQGTGNSSGWGIGSSFGMSGSI